MTRLRILPEGAEPAIAIHLGRDTLLQLAVAGRPYQQREVRVRVHVDEAGADDSSADVYALRALGVREIAQRRDASIFEPHIGGVGTRARTVDDQPTREHSVQHAAYDSASHAHRRRWSEIAASEG